MYHITVREFYLPKGGQQIYVKEYISAEVERTEKSALPGIIICHGFGADCSGENDYCEFFAAHGYAAYCFDFCGGSCKGMGKSSGSSLEMNVWTECDDLLTVLSHVKSQAFVDSHNITLMGTSQGGFVSGLTAARCGNEVKNLVMVCPALCIPDHARRGRLGGAEYDVENLPEKIICPNTMVIGKQFHEAVADVDPFLELEKYEGNVLLIQGLKDTVVNYSYAVKAASHYRKGQCQLKLVREADHCFEGNLRNSVMATIFSFLEGKKEILTIQVFITGVETKEQRENGEKGQKAGETIVYFTGYCDNEYFKGTILPGGKDVQTLADDGSVALRAEYTLYGKDQAGNLCRISIVNQREGEFFRPRIVTDSPALSWLNERSLTAALEDFEGGLTVRIFG